MPFTFTEDVFRFVLGFVPLLEITHMYVISITCDTDQTGEVGEELKVNVSSRARLEQYDAFP